MAGVSLLMPSYGPGVVAEAAAQQRADGVQVRRQHARHVAGRRLAAGVGDKRRQRPRIVLFLEAAKREQLVLQDRPAGPHARVGGFEVTGVEREAFGFGADERLVAETVIDAGRQPVAAAARHGVDAGADEVALAHVVGCHADLHLLDRLERDRRDAGAIAGLTAQSERVVEVGPIDGDVVHPVVLTGERAAPAVLWRQARDVVDAARDGRQHFELVARHRCRRAGSRRAEHRTRFTRDGNGLGNTRQRQREGHVLHDAERERNRILHLGLESGQRSGDRVRPADPHAVDRETSVRLT